MTQWIASLDLNTSSALPLRHRPPALIRPGRAEDAMAIWNVLKAAVGTLIGRPYTRSQIDAWIADEDPHKITRDIAGNRAVLVAESERRIVGFSRFRGIELEALYVHPAHAGRRVGELLLRSVERSASTGGAGIVVVDAALGAVPFYQAAGYQVLGRSTPLFDDGTPLPCIRMQKILQPGSVREISPAYPVRPRLPQRSHPDRRPSHAECCRAWRD